MFKESHAFSSFSVDDLEEAKEFYGDVLGLDVNEDPMGLRVKFSDGNLIFVYPKDDHTPATYTVLHFPVDDIDEAVDELVSKGVKLNHYDEMAETQDEKGIMRGKATGMGPDIAWFKDPAGNVLAVLTD